MSQLAPILIFSYNRLQTISCTIKSLQEDILAKESELHIYCDAAKSEKYKESVNSVRSFISQITEFKKNYLGSQLIKSIK